MHTNLSLTTPYSLCKFVAILHYGCNISHHQCLYFDEEFLIRSVSQVCDLSYFGILQVLKN